MGDDRIREGSIWFLADSGERDRVGRCPKPSPIQTPPPSLSLAVPASFSPLPGLSALVLLLVLLLRLRRLLLLVPLTSPSPPSFLSSPPSVSSRVADSTLVRALSLSLCLSLRPHHVHSKCEEEQEQEENVSSRPQAISPSLSPTAYSHHPRLARSSKSRLRTRFHRLHAVASS